MKIICFYLASLVALSTLGSCKKVCEAPNTNCATAGAVVMEADNWLGVVVLEPNLNAFVVRYGVPGSYDSVYLGIACGLPESLRRDGQKVEFSGKYRAYAGTVPSVPAGTKYYQLELTSATAQ